MQFGYSRIARYLPPAIDHPALPLGKEKMCELQACQGGRELCRKQLHKPMGAISLFESEA